MKPTAAPSLSGEQQVVLEQVIVRLIHPEERPRFDQCLLTGHYLHSADLVGEQLRYIAEVNGQWVALLAWSAPAFALKDREIWIAWSAAQKCRRLSLLANNSRFLVLPEHSVPNLASRVMKLCLQRLAADWQAAYGQQVVSAYTVQGGRWLGSQSVAPGSNEIPAAQTLLRRAPIEGMLVTADALHTQTETARIITQEKGADYLLSVKGNQPQLARTLRQFHPASRRAFPPSASGVPGANPGA